MLDSLASGYGGRDSGLCSNKTSQGSGDSGFLRDYSILQPGKEGEALLVYKNPQADFSMYQAVYVEPAIFLITKKSTVPQEDLVRLANDLRAKVIWKLKQDFLVVPKLVPGALRIELALTEAEPSDVGMDIVSTIIPPAGMVSGAKGLATGTPAFVGRASIEAKVTDGNTGTLLMAAAVVGLVAELWMVPWSPGTMSIRHLSIGRIS